MTVIQRASRRYRFRWFAVALASAAVACNQITINVGGQATTAPPTDTPPPAAAPAEPTATVPPPTPAPTDAPTTAPTAPPTLSPTPSPYAELEIIPGRSFVDAAGNYVVTAEIINHSSQAYSYIELDVIFSDVDGNALAADNTFVTPTILAPGEKGIFATYTPVEGAPDSVADIALSVSGANVTTEAQYAGLEVTVLDEGATNFSAGTYYTLAGEVANTGTQDCASIAIVGGFYDGDDNLLEAITTFTDTEPIPAGNTSTFDMATDFYPERYARVQFWTECYPS